LLQEYVIARESERGKRTRAARVNARPRSSAVKKARGQYAKQAIETANAARIDKNAARQKTREKARELKALKKAAELKAAARSIRYA
jgi:hypothetical protein